jgi:hypothetical protein
MWHSNISERLYVDVLGNLGLLDTLRYWWIWRADTVGILGPPG